MNIIEHRISLKNCILLLSLGTDVLKLMGICETGRAACNSEDTLAEVAESILRISSRTRPTQTTVDNLDWQGEHMTVAFKEVETLDTSNLNDQEVNGTEVTKLFDVNEILIEESKHEDEFSHGKKVAANSVGRLLGSLVKKVNSYILILVRFLSELGQF